MSFSRYREASLYGDNSVARSSSSGRAPVDDENIDTRTTSSGSGETGGAYFVHEERSYNGTSWAYRFPADQMEILRQDRQHFICTYCLPGLYRGPVDEILNDGSRDRRCLDIGCGTGIWLAEMAERFPHVDCVGVDLMPIQHDHHLRNSTYMCLEVPRGMKNFPDRSFDVVHLRQMLYSLDDFPTVIRQAYRVLRPGGIILIYEPELIFYSEWQGYAPEHLAPACVEMMTRIREAFRYRGVDLDRYQQMDQVLASAGFPEEDIDAYVHYRHMCPDELENDIGQNEVAHTDAFTEATRLMVLESGQLTPAEFDALAREISAEIRGKSKGAAGPWGAKGLLSPWGYWWVRKKG